MNRDYSGTNHKYEAENRVEQLMDTVENHTRTERHLEQYSHIGSKENKDHARMIQKAREEEISNLKDKIAFGESYNNNELENLKDNYHKSNVYMEYNKDNMTSEDLSNMKEKQRHRKEQMDSLQ